MEELDLKEIFNMFWTRILHIIIIVLIFMVIGILYSYIYVTPEYKSYTTLLLATSTGETGTDTITTSDISLNNNLVATYSELIKSKTVLREVINNLGIDISEGALKSHVSVSAVKSTQLIQINVVDKYPNQSKIIANEF